MDLSFALDFLNPNPFEFFDTITDMTQIEKTPFFSSYKRTQQTIGRQKHGTPFYLQSLYDRVSALESSFDPLAKQKTKSVDRKYTWTAEIKDGIYRKYKWTAEIKGAENKKNEKRKDEDKEKENEKHEGGRVVKNFKWTTEIKGKGDEAPSFKTYTFKASSGDAYQSCGSEKKKGKKKCNTRDNDTRVVEIEEIGDHRVLVLRQGADLMVRGAKRSMVDELEAMLDVIDPQPGGVWRCLSMKRRMFDLPTGGIQKGIATGVAQVVRMLDREENGTNMSTSTFEACL